MLFVNDKFDVHNYFRSVECDQFPIDRRMNIIENLGIKGMNTENIRFLINEIVRIYAKKGLYLEVGTYRGASLSSAAFFNYSTRCVGIENFSEFVYEKNESIDILNTNIGKTGCKNIQYYDADFFNIGLLDMKRITRNRKIDVYFYDGKHTKETQISGLVQILPYLNDRCIIMVDDINWPDPEEATDEFTKIHGFELLFKIKTETHKGDWWKIAPSNWWNGFMVIGRGI